MKIYGKLLLFLVLSMLLFSLTTVNATQDHATNTAASSSNLTDEVFQENTDSILTISDGDTGELEKNIDYEQDVDETNELSAQTPTDLDESEFSTFKNLDYLISDSINLTVLDCDFAFNPTSDADYVNGIEIPRNNLIIDGNGHSIDGAGMARMFNVSKDNITFKNIRFINGYAEKNGGAIYCRGNNLSIINCTFTNGFAGIEAGAVFARSNYLKIINSTFAENDAIYNGAVYVNGVNASVIKSYFRNNFAQISAGAIGWAGKSNGLIEDSVFIRNAAFNEGGGAIFWNQGKNGQIINCTFEKNYANFNGSAIFWKSENGIISDSVFNGNVATINGAAIYHVGTNNTISGCEFNNNNAENDNGIYSTSNDLNAGNNTFSKVGDENIKIETRIIANEADFIINYDNTYSITLQDRFGNAIANEKITFTLNGKNIASASTNANGVATIALTANILKSAKVGTKNLVIKLNNAKYTPASQTVKVTINKEKTTITAKAKTFKKSVKTKRYSIVLKNGKGKAVKNAKLSIKVKGKTYTAKTNSKGKATFKITKLNKKGTFKATIKFKETALYKKVTKTVKIKIK